MVNNIYTFYYSKNKKNRPLVKGLFCTICVVLALIFTITLLFSNRENYKEKTYYFFSVNYTKDKGQLEYLQKKCTNSGGAGYIYLKDNTYYILAFVYISKTKAEEVLNSNKFEFANASIKELILNKIKNNTVRKIKEELKTTVMLDYINSLVNQIINLYFKNNENQDNIKTLTKLSQMINKCDEYINFIAKFKGEKAAVISQYLNIFKGFLSSCLDSVYKGESILKSLCKLAVSTAFAEYEFRKAINN